MRTSTPFITSLLLTLPSLPQLACQKSENGTAATQGTDGSSTGETTGGSETSTTTDGSGSTSSGGSSSTGSSSSTSAGGTGADCPPPFGLGSTPCEKEATNLLCCGLIFRDADPPSSNNCQYVLDVLAADGSTSHCAALLEPLLLCVAELGCNEAATYVEVALMVDPSTADFAGVACETEAVAVLDAGCPIVTTGWLP